MSSRREVLIRIVALLQRKTLLETKNRTLNCTIRLCDKWKMLQYWWRTGHLPSFFVLTPGNLTAKEFPPPGICYPRQKNLLMPGSPPGGDGRSWNWLMHKWNIITTYRAAAGKRPRKMDTYSGGDRKKSEKRKLQCCLAVRWQICGRLWNTWVQSSSSYEESTELSGCLARDA